MPSKPSLDPIVTTASDSGSKVTSNFLSYQSQMDFLSLGIPFDCEYLCVLGLRADSLVSQQFLQV